MLISSVHHHDRHPPLAHPLPHLGIGHVLRVGFCCINLRILGRRDRASPTAEPHLPRGLTDPQNLETKQLKCV